MMDDSLSSAAPNDDLLCPLCCEEIDPVDKYFYPCPCGYQICRFCWNHIREDLNNLCPACRREFDDASVQFTPPPPDEIARIQADRKRRKVGAKKGPMGGGGGGGGGGYDSNDRSHLKDLKVTQRTLVYVTNMPPKYAVEDVLMGDPYFGQFGRILKLSISRRPPLTQGGKTGENQIGIHVTYASAHEALRCIQYVDGAQIENRTLHATYGQTKYCALWLQNRACNTSNCMFLHEVVQDNDSGPAAPVPKLAASAGPRYFGPRGRAKPGQGPASAGSSSADLTRSNSTGSSASASTSIRRSLNNAGNAYFADDDTNSDTGSALLPATANWATRRPDPTPSPAPSATQRPTTPSGPPPMIQPVRTASMADDPTPAAAAAAAAAAREREREEKARQVALRKEKERKAAVEAARKQALKDEAERRAAEAAAEAERKAKAKAARRREREEAEQRRLAEEEERRRMQAEADEAERERLRIEREKEEEEERRRASILDIATQVLEVVPDVLPIPDLAVHIAAAAATAAQASSDGDDKVTDKAVTNDSNNNKLAGLLHLVPDWILSSTRVILRALDRPQPLGVYTGTFRPFDTGDLMTDILNEKTQSVLTGPPGAAQAPQLPGSFPTPLGGVNPAVAQVLGVNPAAVANPHLAALARTGSLQVLQQQQQQQQQRMSPVAGLPPHLLQAGVAQPPPGLAQQQQQPGTETLAALRRQLEHHQIKRSTTPGNSSAGNLVGPPPGMAPMPPPGMNTQQQQQQQQQATGALPFNDPAIMAMRMDRAAREGSPNNMEPPKVGAGGGSQANIFQQLHDSIAAKVQAQQQQQQMPPSGMQGAGPPPGFGLPLKPGVQQQQQQQQGALASSTPLVSPQPQQQLSRGPPGLVGFAPRPLGTSAPIPSSAAVPTSATANAPPPGFGGFQLQPPQPTPVAAGATNVAPPPGFGGFASGPFAPAPPAAAQFNNINASGAFGSHSAATAAAAGFGVGAGAPSTPFPQPTATACGPTSATAATTAVPSTPGPSVPTTAAARGFARPALGPPPMTPGGEYSPLPIPPPSSSASAAAAAANAFANSYFDPTPPPHLAAAAATGLQSPSAFASSWPAPAALSSSTVSSSVSSFPPPTSTGFNFNMPTPTAAAAANTHFVKDTPPPAPMVTSTYTPSHPVKPNIPPPQPHNRVLILRSDKKPEPVKAPEPAPVDAAAAEKAREPSPSPAPRTKKGRAAAAAAAAAAAKDKDEAAKKLAAQAKRQAPPAAAAAPAEKAPTPTPTPAPAPPASDAEPAALSAASPTDSDQAQPDDAEPLDTPAPDEPVEPEIQEAQILTLDGTDLPISLFGESRAIDTLFGQLFEAQPANGTLPPSPISYGLVPTSAPLATTSQLLSALGLNDVMRDVDAWAQQVLTDAAATTTPGTAGAGAALNMDELVGTLQSFFDRGAQVLFGYALPPASAVPGHLGDEAEDGSKNGSGNTSRGDKEVETVTEFLAKLQAEFDGFNNEYVKADVLDVFREELTEAKKEAAHWEARLMQARKKNRKAGIA